MKAVKRILALALSLVMAFAVLPAGIFRVHAETVTLEKLTEAPKDGDKVVIYHPASGNAMGTAPNGNKLSPVAAALEDVKLSLTEGMAYLTVGVSEGEYSFKLEDGTYLATGATGGNLSFVSELTDLALWIMDTKADGTYTLTNKGAAYNGNHNQALEFFRGAFTTYGIKDNTDYGFHFYAEEKEPEPEHLVPDGDYIIYNPAHKVAVSGEYNGYYNMAEEITVDDVTKEQEVDEKLIWHVTNNDEDGTITISHDGKNWGMAASYSSITLEGENNTWALEETETEGLYLIKNAGRGLYVEYYAKNNNFSGYGNLSQIDLFQFNFVPAKVKEDYDSVLKDGDQVVIYHPYDGASLAMPNELGTALGQAPTTIDGDMAVPSNGARVFTVGVVGDNKYTFKSGSAGYLATNKGETLFFSPELADDNETACTYWTLTPNGDSYIIYSSTAKYNSSYVCIESFGGNFSGWTYKSSDKDLFLFNFYPVTEDTLVVDGIVDKPIVTFDEKDAYEGTEYELKVNITSLFVFNYQDLTITVNGTTVDIDRMATTTGLIYMVYATVPAEMVTGETLEVKISGIDEHGAPIEGSTSIPIIDQPFIKDMTPGRNEETGDNKAPLIGAVITNFGENPSIVMKINGEEVEAEFDALTGKLTYAPKEDLQDGKVTVEIIVTRADGAVGREQWSFWIGEATFSLYFGQLHSHTQYSDGAGTLETALNYIANIPESANVQFVAFTDHSNYFDTTSAANPEEALYDASKMTAESAEKWETYNRLATEFNETHSNILAISGFEMTWSGGPGHINTFKTPGIVSRNNTTLNNKTNDAGLKAYYSLLCESELSGSISQFNHPGSTFGTFADFAYYDPVIDTRMYLVEVGNGEGQIGAGGYYPSYEYYTMALDKGWHVAPTNNQDNHKGSWGNANNARDVILTDDFSVDGLYKAIRDYRVYATEDKNLEILYTVNDEPLGSMFFDIPEELNINVSVYDPDNNDSISKVEVIVNSGKTAYTWDDPAELADGELSVTLAPDYTYYYIRVTEGDGDLAVTAPVWVGDNLLLGISAFESGTAVPVTGEEITLTTTLFNGESTDATVKSLTYTMDGSEVIGTDTQSKTIAAGGTLAVDFGYTADKAKITKITVTAVIEQDGKEYVFTKDIELDIGDADSLVYLGIDASHYNEYVSGNYKDSMGNFSLLASEYGVRTVILDTSDDLIAACENEKYVGLIFTAPSRRLAAAQEELRAYTDDELAAIKAFNDRGGLVVVAGWSDYYENYPAVSDMDPSLHMAAVQNSILEALGTELRINDDATYDDELNGGQPQRLYFNTYNMDNFLMEGVEVDPDHPNDRLYTEVYSHYGGASIYTESGKLEGTVSPAVFGHASTYSKDADEDGIGGESAKKYPVTGTAFSGTHAIRPMADPDERLLITATDEQEGKGRIVVSGAAFMSNFEVQATIEDSGSEKNYSNYKICENLLKQLNEAEVISIEGVRNVTEEGYKFTIEGIVTSNASGYDKDTAFFDCIYVQDETAGICCFPVAGDYKIGDKVRITGSTDFYQGEPELQVISITKIGEEECPAPEEITAAQENDRSEEGKLVKVGGTITKVEVVDGQLQTIIYKDDSGEEGRIFIDGYITTVSAGYEDVANAEVGNKVTAIGLASYDDTFNAPEGPFPRIRIRDRADIVCEVVEPQEPDDPVDPDEPVTPGDRPVTGDMNRVFGWVTIFTLAAAALALLIFTKSGYKGKHYRK